MVLFGSKANIYLGVVFIMNKPYLINQVRSVALSMIAVCTLVACGGEDIGDTDGGAGIIDRFVGDVAAGKIAFELHCKNCHTDVGDEKLVEGHNLAGLADIIDSGMPILDPSECKDQCAADTAIYIAANNTYFDPNAGQNPSGDPDRLGNIKIPNGAVDPAPVVARRLNRTEYNNTVRDLLKTGLSPADNFPEDDFGYGFNNIANVLSVSLLHLEQYFAASDMLARDTLIRANGGVVFEAEAARSEGTTAEVDGGVNLLAGNASVIFDVPLTSVGPYELIVLAGQQAGGPDSARFRLYVNGQEVAERDVPAPATNRQSYSVSATMQAGANSVRLEFLNDFYLAGEADRNLVIDRLTVVSKGGSWTRCASEGGTCSFSGSREVRYGAGTSWVTQNHTGSVACTNQQFGDPTPSTAKTCQYFVPPANNPGGNASMAALPCDVSAGRGCARSVAEDLGARAWRRPLKTAEVNDLLAIYDFAASEANSSSVGIETLLKAILMSPNFLFRIELDPSVSNPTARQLNAYELATRLSYFLWSSMPDDILFDLAKDGSLLDETVLKAQVKRMLADPKSESLIENFAVQWLGFDDVLKVERGEEAFPNYTPALVQSMRTESRLFLRDWLENNGQMRDLFMASASFLDARLAAHYGVDIGDVEGFVRYEWGGVERYGVLGQASILTMTTHGEETSPVVRGKYVLDKFLCRTPPPPPPGVENVGEVGEFSGLTTRERFELHRDKSTVCFSCHILMDPLGFGLENYDAVGRWRTTEGSLPIDASGVLPGNLAFSGGEELASIIADSKELPLCATKHLMTYALGRGIKALDNNDPEEGLDDPLVYRVYSNTKDSGNRIQDIIEEIVLSRAFRSRRGAESSVGGAQ